MKVVIFGNLFTYPEFTALAASGRVEAYAKGMLRNNVTPIIITFSNVYGYHGSLKENDFECFVALQQVKRSSNLLIRRFYRIKKYFSTIKYIAKIQRSNEKIDSFIVYSRSPGLMVYAWLLSKMFSFSLWLEVTEHPKNDMKKYSIWHLFYPILIYKLFDGFICISRYLAYKCSIHKRKDAIVINIPPLIDTSSYTNEYNIPVCYEYLFYSGSLTIIRDGIDDLINSFSKVVDFFPNLKLILGGKWIYEEERLIILKLIKDLNLSDKIIFIPFLPIKELHSYIFNAKVLCINRKKNLQTSAAFPTKLAEYLFSERPVLVTDVGDIPFYLEDNKDAFILRSESIKEYSEKLLFILNNYELALKVAKCGHFKALEFFDNTKNMKYLIENIKQKDNAL